MKEITTIKIMKPTKERLDHLKEHERESYEEIIKKMLYILNLCRKNPEKARKTLLGLDKRIRRKALYKLEIEPGISQSTS